MTVSLERMEHPNSAAQMVLMGGLENRAQLAWVASLERPALPEAPVKGPSAAHSVARAAVAAFVVWVVSGVLGARWGGWAAVAAWEELPVWLALEVTLVPVARVARAARALCSG